MFFIAVKNLAFNLDSHNFLPGGAGGGWAASAGGGYSGGGGTDGCGSGGGGGSYNSGTNQINTAGFQYGNGQAIFSSSLCHLYCLSLSLLRIPNAAK